MDELYGVGCFAQEVGYLKRMPRSGWEVAGVPRPETVAEHSFRVGVLAWLLAAIEGADADRAATLGLFHDVHETRIGDVPAVQRKYVATARPEAVAADQAACFSPSLRGWFLDRIDEYEERQTPEAVCAKDADKLECLLQAREYQAAGVVAVDRMIETSRVGLRTATGRRLAELLVELDPAEWWAQAAADYPALPKAVSG